jgi:tRNA pseudouridine55 synthase
VTCVCKVDDDGAVRVSLRFLGTVDVAAGPRSPTAAVVTASPPASPRRTTWRPRSRRSPPRSDAVRSGLVVVDKPAGWTSHDVVARVRRLYGQRRVGHAGTLTPTPRACSSGLGRVTRLLRFLQDRPRSTAATSSRVATSTSTPRARSWSSGRCR